MQLATEGACTPLPEHSIDCFVANHCSLMEFNRITRGLIAKNTKSLKLLNEEDIGCQAVDTKIKKTRTREIATELL